MRTAVQLLFLAAFTVLFFCSAWSAQLPVSADVFLRLDPLLACTGALAARQVHATLLPALLVLIGTALAGRFFCGYVCPLGTLFDLTGRRARSGKNRVPPNSKYYLLVCIAAAALLGVNLAYFFDPLAFLTRLYTFLLYPASILGVNAGLDFVRPAAEQFRLHSVSHRHYAQPLFAANLLTLLPAAALFVLNYVSPRFWCRSLCPLGGLLALVSRFSIIRRRVSAACNGCMACRGACPMEAVGSDPVQTAGAECILCAACSRVCPQAAVAFSPSAAKAAQPVRQLRITRRAVLMSAGTGFLSAFGLTATPSARLAPAQVIRPPGAVPEPLFLQLCVRCGQCMRVCPTNTLQPCLLESGPQGLWSPRLSPRLAGCDQTCNLCGTVCPTEAIRPLPLEEKKHAKLGTASIDRNRCLVWEQDRLCLICDEQCPYDAIVFRWENGFRRPFVIGARCNGCGFCEEQCPVQGESAIRVTPHNQFRLARGSYIARAEEMQLDLREDTGDDRFLPDDGHPAAGPENGTRSLPGGFTGK